ncbi:mechanosensitive ion channel [Candidatus Woesearchaeota archaeon]|nr:mechanosensitive ion channel [Candidatus Woesearchaeota archaeon]
MAIIEYLSELVSSFFESIVVAVVILFIGFIIAKIVSKIIQSGLKEIELNKILKNAGVKKVNLEKGISKIIFYFIIFFSVIMALNQLGIATTILNIIAAGAVILIVLTLVLAIKDFIPNAFAGLIMQKRGFFREGDYIKVDELEGRVVKINMTETEIQTDKGDLIFVPNSTLYKKNFSVKSSKHKY